MLFLLTILMFKFFVSKFLFNGISFQFVFAIPISVSTKLLSKICDFNAPEDVQSIIDRIPNAKMIQVPSNQYAHEPDVLREIEEFYESI